MKTILIVDDDEPTQKLLEVLMQRYGFATEVAADGSAAISRLREGGDYAVVILDLMMPEVGGHDVLAFIDEQQKPMKVVVCTAALPLREEEFDTRFVKAIVRKPFDIEQLAATVAGLAGGVAGS